MSWAFKTWKKLGRILHWELGPLTPRYSKSDWPLWLSCGQRQGSDVIMCVFQLSIKKETGNFHFVFLDIQVWSPVQPCKKFTVLVSHTVRKPRSHVEATCGLCACIPSDVPSQYPESTTERGSEQPSDDSVIQPHTLWRREKPSPLYPIWIPDPQREIPMIIVWG